LGPGKQCCGTASRWCESVSCFTSMRIRILHFHLIRILCFNLILPLNFSQIWTLQSSKMTF
jgi:hypothetical protein